MWVPRRTLSVLKRNETYEWVEMFKLIEEHLQISAIGIFTFRCHCYNGKHMYFSFEYCGYIVLGTAAVVFLTMPAY